VAYFVALAIRQTKAERLKRHFVDKAVQFFWIHFRLPGWQPPFT
jgi:hypothetical protein